MNKKKILSELDWITTELDEIANAPYENNSYEIEQISNKIKSTKEEINKMALDNEDVGNEALASMAEITAKLAIKVKADITELFRLVHDISEILVTQQKQIEEIKNK